MQLLKLTILSSLLFAVAVSFISCEKEADRKRATEYSRTAIAMTGAQENNPLNTSSAIGSMDVFYSKASKTLVYKVTWSGLTDSVLLMHIHGLAPVGFNAGVVQNIVTPTLGLFNQKTNGKFTFSQSGTISGSFNVDGVTVKEENLLNGFYYMNIHTNTYPGGEIRGQIKFQ